MLVCQVQLEQIKKIQYDMKKDPNWMAGGPWYNTSICEILYGTVFEFFFEIQELTDIISCVLLIHMKKIIHHIS